ncbi:MAG: hypothetical protein KJO18_10315 [Acidimicrobiia bacterium]|nr:hypothetical protein [Acidimicrobiia bacterium]
MDQPVTPAAEQTPSKGDIALAGSLLGVAVLSGVFIDANRPDTVEPSMWWHWLLIATPPVLVAFRRRSPVLVAALASVAQAGIWISDLPEVLLPIIVILYAAASEAGRRGLQVAVAASVGLTIVTAVGVRIADDVTLYQLPLIALTCGTAIVLGVNAARQRQVAAQLASTVTESRMRSEHERAQAVAEERSHIARELHDVIGHTLTVIAVRAEAADRVGDRQSEAAGDAVAAIAEFARSALNETRRVLAGLQQSSAADLSPPPDIAATRRLVAEVADGGVRATLHEHGCNVNTPPAVVAGGIFRIVQESLTNAIKHGGPEVVIDVYLTCRADDLEVRIENSINDHAPVPFRDLGGMGLAGMAERASVLGGTFHVEQTDGRFVVHAKLPIDLARAERITP